jgi:hypothetical protein
MKVYIATRFTCKDDFRKLAAILESHGHEITHDWTQDDVSKVSPEEVNAYLTLCAARCLKGIHDADAFVMLARPGMAGAHFEFGFAVGYGITAYVLDAFEPGVQPSIFYHLPQMQKFRIVGSVKELLDHLAPKTKTFYDGNFAFPVPPAGDNAPTCQGGSENGSQPA